MKKLLLILAAAAMPAVSFAQGAFTMDQKGGGFYVAPFLYFSNIQDQYSKLGLDSTVTASPTDLRNPATYPKPSNTLTGITIGGFGVSSSIIYGGEVNIYYGASKSSSLVDATMAAGTVDRNYTLKTSTLGGDVLATVGIVAYRNTGLVVAPILGLGFGEMGMFIKDSRNNRQYPYYTTGNQENKYLYNMGFTFDIGLGVDYYMGGETSKAKGFRLGLKAGYRSQSPGAWNASGGGIVTSNSFGSWDAPSKLGSNGAYVKLTLGVGTIGKK